MKKKTPRHLFNAYSKQVKRCMEIALRCVEADRYKRPSIGDIVKQLNEIETETDTWTDQVCSVLVFISLFFCFSFRVPSTKR